MCKVQLFLITMKPVYNDDLSNQQNVIVIYMSGGPCEQVVLRRDNCIRKAGQSFILWRVEVSFVVCGSLKMSRGCFKSEGT